MIPGISPVVQGEIVNPGSIFYTTPGDYSFVCPNFNTLTVTVKGAGAGGWSFQYTNSVSGTIVFPIENFNPGEASLFNNIVVGSGGIYGTEGVNHDGTRTLGTTGAAGVGSGGDTNTTGGGSAGGLGGADDVGTLGGTGGAGGKAVKAYTAGQLEVGKSYPIVVGAKGLGSTVLINTAGFAHPQGYDGTDGSVEIVWT